MSHIDSIDERILGELQANGRLTMKALAERVGLSSPAMIERARGSKRVASSPATAPSSRPNC